MSTKNSSDDEQLSAIAKKREKKLQKKIKQKDTDETVENVEENVEEKPVKNERKKRPLTDRQRAALAAGRKVRQEKQAALKKLRLQLQSEAKKGVREYVKKGIKQHQLNELISDERIKLPGEEETEEEIDERILAVAAKEKPTKIKKSKQKVIEESSESEIESENEETAESESESDESGNEETESESESSESEVEEPPKVLKSKRKLTSESNSRRRKPTSTKPDKRINQNELNQRKNSKKNQKTKRTRKQSRVVEYDTESSEFSSSSGGNAEPDESEVLRAWGF